MLRRAVGSIKISRAIVNLPPFLSLSLSLSSFHFHPFRFVRFPTTAPRRYRASRNGD